MEVGAKKIALWAVLVSVICGILLGITVVGPWVSKKRQNWNSIKNDPPIDQTVDIFIQNPSYQGISIETTEANSEFPSNLLENQQVIDQVIKFIIEPGVLRDLPDNFGQFHELTTLTIFQNRLTTLPPSIGNIAPLETITILDNPMAYLPDEIGNLVNLRTLVVNGGYLETLPPTIGNLTQLSVLDLRNNNISILPEEIKLLKNLKYLYLGGNPIDPVIAH